jgi:hypothetical protein
MSRFRRIPYAWLLVCATFVAPVAHAADGAGKCAISPLLFKKGIVSNDGPDGASGVNSDFTGHFLNFPDSFDQFVRDWSQAGCQLDDGRPWIGFLTAGIDRVIEMPASDRDRLFNRSIEAMKKKNPQSPVAAAAEAQYWITLAWDARGSGYYSTVTPDGEKLFRERLLKAERILLESKHYASSMPFWYAQMVEVQGLLGRPEEALDKTFYEGAEKFRTYYPLYFVRVNFLSPKWGGNWAAVDKLVTSSVKLTNASEGNSMYARLYWALWRRPPEGARLFGNTRASWPKMKKGFEDLMERHPKSKWNLNNFAKFACTAEDKKTFLVLRKQIADSVVHDAWTENPSLDLCDHKFGYAK